MLNRRISVAPMMDYTDRHARYFLRLIAPSILLYTEMVTTSALCHGNIQRLLEFHSSEHPVALQLGGSEPEKLVYSARLGEEFGYDEINLNVGCPSNRVTSGRFGACLMQEPQLVAECVNAMCHAVKIPVTVKCRIGVDNNDSYEALVNFIQTISQAGCKIFIIHARKAWLKGLSPKENREIPPLQYDTVRQIKQDFPQLTIIMNGGIKTAKEVQVHLKSVDGVMIGRAAYNHPYFLTELKTEVENIRSRVQVIEDFIPYMEQQLKNQVRVSGLIKPLLGLFWGQKNARVWRQCLSAQRSRNPIEMIHQAIKLV